MTPGINAIETAKPFYIKDEENTILCDEIGTFYCSQKENKCNNFDGIETSCDTSSNGGGGGGRASTSASLTAATSTNNTIASINHACFNCNETINDKWLIFVNNTHWHVNCLKCSSCSHQLNDLPTCFWRENRIFCKSCYQTQFVEAKCAACQRPIAAKDWVRRAREFVYHLACFACSHCKRQLSTGEEFSLTDNRLLCKQHYLELIHGQCKAKTKRVRTTFAEEQLSVLQAHFQIDSNPDGADLEKIANITGLSKRVTQVWFQNSRARQKKYQGSKKSRVSGGGSDRCGSATNISGRSSATEESAPGSPNGCDGMMFPTSVTTSADDIDKPMDSMMFSE
uniref:LIM/homeobox protein Awh n=1 Tax=Panagrolaimus sp. PS1159 TaxID=55785 RepID=A0AC35G7B4_9BILA